MTWTLLAVGSALAAARRRASRAGRDDATTDASRRQLERASPRTPRSSLAARGRRRDRMRAASPRPGRAPRPRGARRWRVAVLVLGSITRTYPNYDSYYHLVWGRELLDGVAPSFEAYAAPTQHPLYVALGARPGAGLRRVRRPRPRARLPALARRAGARDLPARRGGVRALERRAGRAVRRRQRVVPALRRARLRRRAVPRARRVGGRARGRRPRPARSLLVLAGLLRPEAWVLGRSVVVWLHRRVVLRARRWPPRR